MMKAHTVGGAFPDGKSRFYMAKAISPAEPGKPPGIPIPRNGR